MSVAATKRGALIVFEGVDRCGKSTQTQRLLERLRSQAVPAELVRFPDRSTDTGRLIDAYLSSTVEMDDHAIHLLFSANRWAAVKTMKEKLLAGTTLIVDRYAFSGVCFSAAKGIDLEWCQAPDVGLPAPDAVVFLNLSIEESKKRGNFGEERYENEDFQQAVLGHFLALKSPDWRVLDATKSVEDLSTEIIDIAKSTIAFAESKPLAKLWVAE